MTSWSVHPVPGEGPVYVRLADAIEAAVDRGALPSGAKLPPQRDLAFDLKVTIGTIGRAYGLLRERGLVSGEVGRGTYVLARTIGERIPEKAEDSFSRLYAGTRQGDPFDHLRMDTTAAPEIGQGEAIGRILASIAVDHPMELASYSRTHPQRWLDAGGQWLSRNGWTASPDDVVPTHGAHAAGLAAIAAVTATGDRVAFENFTYSPLSRAARLIGRRIVSVDSDDEGMMPDDFERVCAQQHPKVAFLMPGLQNPTLAVMSGGRRQAIAEVARRHGVWLIEDEIYGRIAGDPTPLLASFAPERTFVVGGLSKSVAAGVRGGWVATPPHLAQRVKATHRMLTGGLTFILAEAGARLVLSGEAEEMARRSLDEIRTREAVLRRVFEGHDFRSRPQAPFVWLKLPDPWLSGTFKNAALKEGILIDDEDEFKSERLERSFHRVRIAFSGASRTEMDDGLRRLRTLLDGGAAAYDSED